MDFDQIYRSAKDYFGSEPNHLLSEHYTRIDRSGRVLDLGAGQGRNSLFLARRGYGVDAVDRSKVAVETISTAAAGEDLDIRAYHCGFETFQPETDSYSAILALGLIQLLSRDSIELLIARIRAWTRPDSMVFVMTFTTEDPTYERFKNSPEWTSAGRNSFLHQTEGYRTFHTAGELFRLFNGFQPIYHQEGLDREHRHGDGKPARHVWAEGIFRKE
jgi:SAM-dependent methyltransferase